MKNPNTRLGKFDLVEYTAGLDLFCISVRKAINLNRTDFFDLLLMVGWNYIHGFVFAWFLGPLMLNPHWTGSLFAVIAFVIGMIGIANRILSGRFPLGIALFVFAIPFICSITGVTWWVIDIVQRWLGVI